MMSKRAGSSFLSMVFVAASLEACGTDAPAEPAAGPDGSSGKPLGIGGSGTGGDGVGHSGDGGTAAGPAAGAGGGAGAETGDSGRSAADTLSARHPRDVDLASDSAVLFYDDFENGWGKWAEPHADTQYLHVEETTIAHGGAHALRSTVTTSQLADEPYISAHTRADLPRRVNQIYWRFYARFKGIAPNPHHWVRVAAGNESWSSSGLANTVPPGDGGYWFDFDADNADTFNFYVYWYKMRSGRCNDGTAIAGCAGDQGTTYYYGNTFSPPDQPAFTRDRWLCIEMMGKGNTVDSQDGELAFWIDNQPVGEYRTGYPVGTWLRDSFHTGGCTFSACTAPLPFEGFDFRSNGEVLFKQLFLDAYYERDSSARKKTELEQRGLAVSDEQTIYYDDVVVATERIGCRVD
jgi:hypothetical protein